MISGESLYPIGYVSKTHGIKGELNIKLDTSYNPEDFRFLVFELDSTFIPFQIYESRGNGLDSRLVSLEDIKTVEEAKQFVGKTVYVLLSELREHPDYNPDEEQSLYLSDLIGYDLLDENRKLLGKVIGYNDDTENYLLEIELPDNRKIYVPFVEDWILELNQDDKILSLNLPLGIIE